MNAILFVGLLTACETRDAPIAGLQRTGIIVNRALDEASGMQASRLNPGVYFLHNDDTNARVYAITPSGADLGSFLLDGARNRDWEDMTWAPSNNGPLLVLADIGDNFATQSRVRLFFTMEPAPDTNGKYSGNIPLVHQVALRYPEGSRDCESISYDTYSGRLILLSKRDKPARIYSIALEDALTQTEATLRFDGLASKLRSPGAQDIGRFGRQGWRWISQPTGLDIHPDGKRAAVITYRSLYLFERLEHESWATAFAREPVEYIGPPSLHEEAVAWAADGESIMITSEKTPAPVYRIRPVPDS